MIKNGAMRCCAAAIACAALTGCGGSNTPQTEQPTETLMSSAPASGQQYQSTGDESLLAVSLPARLDDQTLRYRAITVHYNKRYRIPNCVAYELTATQVAMCDAPDAERRDDYKFNSDPQARGCADWWEYKNTGYDRGHMAPAMDMRWDATAMEQCFLMTNICPQRHELNDGEWRHMEEAVHNWARKAGRLVIFTGPVIRNDMERIGKKHDIGVPKKYFKVIYAPERRRAIAFLFDNKKVRSSWTSHVVSVDDVELLTGIDFLASLPDDVENAVESHSDIKDWPSYTPRR